MEALMPLINFAALPRQPCSLAFSFSSDDFCDFSYEDVS
jgi:hypothetical protein